jgi:hypothetical protein
VRIDLTLPVIVRGTIKDQAGHAVAKAGVSATSPIHELLGAYDWTDADGRFELLDLAPGEIHLDASGRKEGKVSEIAWGAAGEVIEWHGVLDKGLRIRGRVLDERDVPIPGWHVRASPSERSEKLYLSDGITGTDGSFLIEQCRDIPHHIEVWAPATVLPAAERDGIRPGDDLLIRIADRDQPSVRISGRVIRPDGEVGGGAMVVPWNSRFGGGPIHYAEVSTGRFDIQSLVPGTYRVHIQVPGQPWLALASHVLAAGESWDMGDVELEEPGTVVAHITRAASATTKVELSVSAPGDLVSGDGWTLEIEEGTARSQPLAPGTYRLNVTGPGIASSSRPIQVEAGAITEVDLAIASGATRRVTFQCAHRAHQLHLLVLDDTGQVVIERAVYPSRDGTAETVLCLAPGTYRVEASDPDGHRGEVSLDVADLVTSAGPLELRVQ